MSGKSGILPAYKGSKPYIFVSYAHKNSSEVYRIISRLQQEGYRVWYDKGIDPGIEWAEYIARKISGCGYFIAFISPEHVRSSNCQDELNYARDMEKKRLLIYLTPTELTEGMKMRFNSLQAIHKYGYDSESDFYEMLFCSDGISTCLASEDEKEEINRNCEKTPENPAISCENEIPREEETNNAGFFSLKGLSPGTAKEETKKIYSDHIKKEGFDSRYVPEIVMRSVPAGDKNADITARYDVNGLYSASFVYSPEDFEDIRGRMHDIYGEPEIIPDNGTGKEKWEKDGNTIFFYRSDDTGKTCASIERTPRHGYCDLSGLEWGMSPEEVGAVLKGCVKTSVKRHWTYEVWYSGDFRLNGNSIVFNKVRLYFNLQGLDSIAFRADYSKADYDSIQNVFFKLYGEKRAYHINPALLNYNWHSGDHYTGIAKHGNEIEVFMFREHNFKWIIYMHAIGWNWGISKEDAVKTMKIRGSDIFTESDGTECVVAYGQMYDKYSCSVKLHFRDGKLFKITNYGIKPDCCGELKSSLLTLYGEPTKQDGDRLCWYLSGFDFYLDRDESGCTISYEKVQ